MGTSKQQYKAALALVAEYDAAKKAKTGTTKAKAKVTRRKTTNRKAVVGGAVEGHRCLTRKNRAMFIADHDWATTSTEPVSSLVTQVLLDGQPLTGTWAIGKGHVAKALGLDDDDVEPVTRESQDAEGKGKASKVKAKKVKATKKGKKAKAAKVVEVVESGPEWGSPAWIAATHPREKDTPRNAAGRPTPRKEWPIRIELERSGKHDRHEVDAKIALAYKDGLIEA